MASAASSIASPCGLPVSWCITSASWASRRVIAPFQVCRCFSRSSKDSAPHHAASSRARSTAACTSSGVLTGWVPTTSPVRGLSDSNVVPVAVRSEVAVIGSP